jgi:15-cis-phytoene synthase
MALAVSLDQSFAECRRITARSRSTFRFAFRLLPPHKAEAMNALYAMARITDDLADGPGLAMARRLALTQWKTDLRLALAGKPTHPIHPALCHVMKQFELPAEDFFQLIAGCLQDVFPEPFPTAAELRQYCYRVSCTIGLNCVRIWGVQPGVAWTDVEPPALEAGYAFQLTNILRDIAEDGRTGRVYLPQDELASFGIAPPNWAEAPRFNEFLNWQLDHVQSHYAKAETLTAMLSSEGQAIYVLMMRAYRELAGRLRRAGPKLLKKRIRLSAWQKLKLLWASRS